MLSGRCLIFTDCLVYFVCHESTNSESIAKDPNFTADGDVLPGALFGVELIEDRDLCTDWELLCMHIEGCTQRILSHDNDVSYPSSAIRRMRFRRSMR